MRRKYDSLRPRCWLRGLQTRWVGQGQVRYAFVMDSTNRVLGDMARRGATAGSMAICEVQRQGRGRLNRRWDSTEGEGLLQSLLLRPRLSAEKAQLCTLAAAVAMAQAIEEAAPGLRVGIKWPNDLVLGGRKCAGILSEMVADGSGIRHIVVGVGVNVNQRSFAGELREKATSLWIARSRAETPDPSPVPGVLPCILPAGGAVKGGNFLEGALGRPLDRRKLLRAYLLRMEAAVEAVERAGLGGILAEYTRRSVTLGQPVRVEGAGEAFTGIAECLDEQGALWVREDRLRENGENEIRDLGSKEKGALGPRRVLGGDVSVRGVMGYVETKV